MAEPEFHDKEEAWAYYAEKQKQAWESLSEEELIAEVDRGNVDLFFTLPEVVAAKLPKDRALLALFGRALHQNEDFLVNYHNLDNLRKLLGEPVELGDMPADSLYARVLRGFQGEVARRAACRELWQRMTGRVPSLLWSQQTPDFNAPAEFLSSRVEVSFHHQMGNFSFYHPGEKFSIATFESMLREKFEKFRTWAWFSESASLDFRDEEERRVAVITGFPFPCEISIFFGGKKKIISDDLSEGPWFLSDPLLLVKTGERNYDLENRLVDVITDPLGLASFGFSRFRS